MKGKYTLVEDVLGISADRYWMFLPGFNGYEISNDGYIRSMKHYRKYPFGLLIQPKKDKNGNIICPEDPTYELSTNQNERVAIKLSQLQYLAETNEYQITGYPRRTCITDISPRNQQIFIKKRNIKPEFSKERFFPKFNIIREDELKINPFARRRLPEIICPIESIDNAGEYYGRKDYKAYINTGE